MSKKKEKTSHLEEEVCMLCRRADVHEDICGPLLGDSGLRVHKFCLFFADSLYLLTLNQRAVLKFPLDAIRRTIEEAEQKHCFVCGEKGASICCAETDCEHSFHLPCATDGECVTHFFGNHRSFCCDHRPQQIVEAAPEPDTCCVICLEPVGDQNSYHTMVCRVCLQAWFHRSCIQGYAISAGILRFRCPVCRDRVRFRTEMHILGIQIPARRPTWEDQESYEVLHAPHSCCDVDECQHTEGRKQAEEEGPWELLLCTSCAVQGTHRKCASLSDSTISWECDICAAADAASSAESQPAGPSTASQEEEGPSDSSPAPDNQESESTSQAALESSQSPQMPKRSSLSSQPRTGQKKKRVSISSQHQEWHYQGSSHTPAPDAESSTHGSTSEQEVGHSSSSPAAECRRQSRQQGTGRTRSRSPLERRASNSSSPRRRSRGSRCSADSGAENSKRSSASQRSARAGNSRRQSTTSRRQSQSSVQSLASNPSSQSQGRRGSRVSPTPGAESSTQSSATQETRRASRDSRASQRRRSSLLQRGQPQERSRSPLDRRASNSQSEAGGSHSGSPRQRRPSRARRHSRNQP